MPHQGNLSLACQRDGNSPHLEVKVVRALEHIRRMRGGSQSHLMRCSDGNYYVVKFQNNPQGRRILVNEMLGTKLAALLGLPTLAVAIIDVSQELIRLTTDLCVEMPRRRIPFKQGLQFGSRYEGDPHNPTLLECFSDEQLLSAQNLVDFVGMLAFDTWTCNTDGRQVILAREHRATPYQALMFDQGFCFNSRAWNFPDSPRRNLYAQKVVYKQVRGIESFEPWLAKLESEIGLKVLLNIAETIPPEWYESDTESLHRLLEQLDSRKGLVRELLWTNRSSTPQFFPNWIEGFEQRSAPKIILCRGLVLADPLGHPRTRIGTTRTKTVGRRLGGCDYF